MSEQCKHCGRTIVLWGGDGKLWVHKDDGRTFCAPHYDDNNDRAEPSPEPEAAPASEAQAMTDYREQAIRDVAELATTYYKPHRFGDGPAWYAACVAACRELAQLRARIAILEEQKVELPEKWRKKSERAKFVHKSMGVVPFLTADESIELFNQLLDAQRAVQALWGVARKQNEALKFLAQEADGEISPATFEFANSAAAAYDALAGKGE